MLSELPLLTTLMGGLCAAVVLGFITQKLRLSPIVGYLLAGVLVSPYTPVFRADAEIAHECAEIGVILLMFGVGLHFHLKDLVSVRKIVFPGALFPISIATVLGMLVGHLIGWGWEAGCILGVSVSVASTVVLTRVLSDNNATQTTNGHVALGWLVVEDMFTIIVLVLLPAIVQMQGTDGGFGDIILVFGKTVLKLVMLIAFALIVGQKLIPILLTYVARTGTRDLFTLAVLSLALGIAAGAAYFFGASMALGAFLAGMIVGQSEFSARAAAESLPMRDAFAVLFFVSVGMLFDPTTVLDNWKLAFITLAIVMLGKPIVAFTVVTILRKPLRMSLTVALALSQIGEFSFILSALGVKLGLVPKSVTSVIVVTALVSITLNPLVFKLLPKIERWLRLIGFRKKYDSEDSFVLPENSAKHRIIVLGYGPVGRAVERILSRNGIEVVILEMNIDTVHELRSRGKQVVYGDATQPAILTEAGIRYAEGLILSAQTPVGDEIIRVARAINPDIGILVRANYLKEANSLRHFAKAEIFSGEQEVAISMAVRLLEGLGATNDQIDAERARIREETV